MILLLDNLEDLLDEGRASATASWTRCCGCSSRRWHCVKAIITTRVPPGALLLEHPERQQRLDLDEGLASPYAENILRAMDHDGKVGLRDAPEGLLATARERTRGYPRALEALFGILSADRDTSLPEVLATAAAALPEHVVKVLVGEAYSRLDRTAQLVLEALAVYGRPVPPVALDFLLQPYEPGANASPVLSRLVNMHFVRREPRLYYLHQVDHAYALSRIPPDGSSGRRMQSSRRPEGGAGLYPASPFAPGGAIVRKNAARSPGVAHPGRSDAATGRNRPALRGRRLRRCGGVLGEIDFDYLLLWGH